MILNLYVQILRKNGTIARTNEIQVNMGKTAIRKYGGDVLRGIAMKLQYTTE